MDHNIKLGFMKELNKDRFWAALWKRTVLAAMAVALVVGFTGCVVDDLLTPFFGDIPFEQEQTVPPDMGAVDDTPTVPEDDSPLDNKDFRPL